MAGRHRQARDPDQRLVFRLFAQREWEFPAFLWPTKIRMTGVLPHFRMLPTVLTKMLPPLYGGLQERRDWAGGE